MNKFRRCLAAILAVTLLMCLLCSCGNSKNNSPFLKYINSEDYTVSNMLKIFGEPDSEGDESDYHYYRYENFELFGYNGKVSLIAYNNKPSQIYGLSWIAEHPEAMNFTNTDGDIVEKLISIYGEDDNEHSEYNPDRVWLKYEWQECFNNSAGLYFEAVNYGYGVRLSDGAESVRVYFLPHVSASTSIATAEG